MPNTNTDQACPGLDQYQRLTAGELPDGDKEALLIHLESCDSCSQKLKSLPEPDTLVALLRQADTVDDAAAKRMVAELVERLSKMRPRPMAPAANTEPAISVRPEATIDQKSGTAEPATYDFLAPAQQADEIGRLGGYRILEVLGAGGMGVVFRAEDPQLARMVALKAMLPGFLTKESARQRFLREAQAAAAIKHDHIVSIYQVGEDRGALYLAMELLEGESLDARLQRQGKLSATEVMRIGRHIAQALAAAHKRGLIHRDIKPANIWIEAESDRVKILDFGLARGASDGAHITQQGAIVGTPAYMAPEQGQGKELDHRCDLFSLGCVMYRMATGSAPFRGADMVSTLVSVAMDTPRPPHVLEPSLPPALSELIVQLLAKEAADRPASAQAVAEKLDRIGQDVARPAPPTAQSAPAKPRRRWPAVATAVVFFALVAAGVVFFLQTPDGAVRIEIDDPEIQLAIAGHTATITNADKQPITLKPGKHGLTITRGDFTFDTASFELPRRGKTALKITWHPGQKMVVAQDGTVIGEKAAPLAATTPKAGPSADPDRRAAEWVLSIGGKIQILVRGKETRDLQAGAKLPQDPFVLTTVYLWGIDTITDASLANLQGCKHVEQLFLAQCPITDDGLASLRLFPKLRTLNIAACLLLTDAGMKHVGQLTGLEDLVLPGVSDRGMAQLSELVALRSLRVMRNPRVTAKSRPVLAGFTELRYLAIPAAALDGDVLRRLSKLETLCVDYVADDLALEQLGVLTKLTRLDVTDSSNIPGSGLTVLAKLPEMRALHLENSGINDEALKHLSLAPKLASVNLTNTPKVTDAGLVHIKQCPNLKVLALGCSQFTDAGLPHLMPLTGLEHLNLGGKNGMTEGAVKKLAAALPKCRVEWNGSVIEPSKK